MEEVKIDAGQEARSTTEGRSMSLLQEFERMKDLAEARALSAASLERPLTDAEFQRYKEVCKNLGIEAKA